MFHFNCNQCAFALNIAYIPREYVLPDGSCVAMMQRHVWCESCATITPAEALDEDTDAKDASRNVTAQALRKSSKAHARLASGSLGVCAPW